MAKSRAAFPFDLVIMLGDNMYGGQSQRDFVNKFEKPYAALLAAGVRFQASIGNHDDDRVQLTYKHFNMNGQRHYSFVRGNVRFLALDSNLMDKGQLAWLDTTLAEAKEEWKIAYFHHPLYSNADRHGSAMDLRVLMEPIFIKHRVNVVFQGHDHVYERLQPQNGIVYFVSGAGGQLRRGNMSPTKDTAAYFDQDRSFMLVEIAGSTMYFQSISRTGQVVDSGVIQRQSKTPEPEMAAAGMQW
jgi:3',5'-cyclic AMP phosphodiesterase CpdA